MKIEGLIQDKKEAHDNCKIHENKGEFWTFFIFWSSQLFLFFTTINEENNCED